MPFLSLQLLPYSLHFLHSTLAMKKLLAGIKAFKAGYYANERARFMNCAKGQNPRHLFICCSDSRVLPSRITESGPGELFIIRNIANMVPPYHRAEEFLAVSSAVEYAVEALEVENIIVCGHSDCGGCKLLMNGGQDRLLLASKWVELSAGVATARGDGSIAGGAISNPQLYERNNVVHQMKQLLSYPSIAKRHEQGRLALWGWHYIIESGEIYQYNKDGDRFEIIN